MQLITEGDEELRAVSIVTVVDKRQCAHFHVLVFVVLIPFKPISMVSSKEPFGEGEWLMGE